MRRIKTIFTILSVMLLTGCGAYFNQPIQVEEARLGEPSEAAIRLTNLPQPKDPIYAAVYRFRDQTGQYKPSEIGSTFSTAVTQGATTILIKALEDSGWFVPIERENVQNLLNEREIIEKTQQQYNRQNGTQQQGQPVLPPLLYAGILLEGGIISYDSNIITGGFGARYFGAGGSTEYRQDRVTVYLRAVSTSNGEVLKTVYTSRTILSQGLDGGFFRFVRFQKLLEAETGITVNEPSQMAVADAIEKAVESLIIEGVDEGLWTIGDEESSEMNAIVEQYKKEKAEAINSKIYNRLLSDRRGSSAINTEFGGTLLDGDYNGADVRPYGEVGAEFFINQNLSVDGTIGFGRFSVGDAFATDYNFANINLNYLLLPNDKLSPYANIGFGGYLPNDGFRFSDAGDAEVTVNWGVGAEYLVQNRLGMFIGGDQNIFFTDEIDGLANGTRDDYYWRLGVGANFYLGRTIKSKKLNNQNEETLNPNPTQTENPQP